LEQIGFVEGKGTTTEVTTYSFVDKVLSSGIYNYRLKQLDFDGTFKYYNLTGSVEAGIPAGFELFQNYPNPFNPSTTLSFVISHSSIVTLKVYDVLGTEVASLVDEFKRSGRYEIEFSAGSFGDASGLSSGVYFYKLTSGGFSDTKKMILLQ
jgi:hypothetical protein